MVGVAGTFYFSIWYAPSYIDEINSKKINITHESLIGDVQELLFYDKEPTIADIELFIKSKELEHNVSYPFTSDELLLQTQDRFMSNKFIPLDKRTAIFEVIKNIRLNYEPIHDESETSFKISSLFYYIVPVFGVLASFIGLYSLRAKTKIDKQYDTLINKRTIETKEVLTSLFKSGVDFSFYSAGMKVVPSESSDDFDCSFEATKETDGKTLHYIVETKYQNKKIPLNTIIKFIGDIKKHNKNGILISNIEFSTEAKALVQEHNSNSDTKVYLIPFTNIDNLKNKLCEITSG